VLAHDAVQEQICNIQDLMRLVVVAAAVKIQSQVALCSMYNSTAATSNSPALAVSYCISPHLCSNRMAECKKKKMIGQSARTVFAI
jgi:hypothetical protein